MGEALISKRRHIGIRLESAKGTYLEPATADCAIYAYDIKISPTIGRFDRDVSKAYLSKLPGIVGTKAVSISFTCEVRHTANATTLDVWERALQACGFKLTSSTLAPTSNQDEQKTASIAVSLGSSNLTNSVIVKAKGCVGTVVFEGKVGQPLLARFTFTGVYEDTVDGSLEVPTHETGIPAIFQGVTFTWGVNSRICQTVTLDVGNSMTLRESVNASTGYLHGVITDRRPRGTIDPDLELVATEPFHSELVSNTSKSISFVVTTGGSGRTQTFACTDVRVTSVDDADRNGIAVAGIGFEIVDTSDTSSADGDLTITLA